MSPPNQKNTSLLVGIGQLMTNSYLGNPGPEMEDPFSVQVIPPPDSACLKILEFLYERLSIYRGYMLDIRVIPQGTVDNNLGPDRLAGTKALDPNYADNQPFDCRTFV